eukprot:m51a1_g7020 hypothetical protein (297) ;mRNA; r:40960-41850
MSATYGVTGASGHLGGLAVKHLIARGAAPADIVAFVRDPSKPVSQALASQGVRLAALDYTWPVADQTRAIREAGVTRMLLVPSSDLFHSRAEQHRAVIASAKAAGCVQFLAVVSLLRADKSTALLGADYRETERALWASGLASFALLRNTWYVENVIGEAAGTGAVTSCGAVPSLTPAARTDLAEAAAAVLLKGPAAYGGAVLELAGDDEVTLPQIAEAVGRRLGKAVPFRPVTAAEMRAGLAKAMPPPLPDLIASSDEAIGKGEMTDKSRTLSAVLGHPTMTLAQAVDAFFASSN